MQTPQENPKKLISIIAGCYNEEDNIAELFDRIKKAIAPYTQYDFEVILADNCSTDNTVGVIRELASQDKRLKAILNVRNFGHIRSPYHALLTAQGDAVIGMASDLEDPPELLPQFIEKWEQGFKIAIGVRAKSDERGLMPHFRNAYYALISRVSDIEQVRHFTGFGLYDKQVIQILRSLNDPYPYFRGLICDIGFPRAEIPFHKPMRKHGLSKGTFFVYVDSALLGIVNHTKAPLRLATLFGIGMSVLSVLIGLYYLFRKLTDWNEFDIGIAPLMVGQFFFLGIMFFLLGLIGEYVGLLVTHVVRRPMVVERERINFD